MLCLPTSLARGYTGLLSLLFLHLCGPCLTMSCPSGYGHCNTAPYLPYRSMPSFCILFSTLLAGRVKEVQDHATFHLQVNGSRGAVRTCLGNDAPNISCAIRGLWVAGNRPSPAHAHARVQISWPLGSYAFLSRSACISVVCTTLYIS